MVRLLLILGLVLNLFACASSPEPETPAADPAGGRAAAARARAGLRAGAACASCPRPEARCPRWVCPGSPLSRALARCTCCGAGSASRGGPARAGPPARDHSAVMSDPDTLSPRAATLRSVLRTALRVGEYTLALAGGACLIAYGGACARASLTQQRESDAFDAALRARIAARASSRSRRNRRTGASGRPRAWRSTRRRSPSPCARSDASRFPMSTCR